MPRIPSFLLGCSLLVASPGMVGSLIAAEAAPHFPSASVPTPRQDPNSRLAHEQLVQKAKSGRIDLYFLGDSITRRWGSTDPQWAPMLEHWQKRFFGWNAGNFGWGADRIEHILWRIQNGELSGVNPRVIVILAGTNNVDNRPGDATKVPTIVEGLRTLVATCRELAPEAKIILTGILPRNDNPAVWPEIRAINGAIQSWQDGKTLFYLDINDQLADSEGRLFEGMTVDKLHLSVQGYEVWAQALEPLLTRFLGVRATTDSAPPPTGDPSAAKPATGS